MVLDELQISRVKVTDLIAVTQITHANMPGADSYFTNLISNPLIRWSSYFTLPFYFLLAGRGYKVVYRGLVIGCAFLNLRRRSGYIFNVSVNQPYRRQGVARRLMAHLEEETRSKALPWLVLQVDSDNIPATNLYRALGFQAVHPHFLRWDGSSGILQAPSDGVEVERLSRHRGRAVFRRYAQMEWQRDSWPADIVEDYNFIEESAGVYYRCLLDGREAGCARQRVKGREVHIRLALRSEHWASSLTGAVLRAIVDQSIPGPPKGINLILASSAHHEAAASLLQSYGFKIRLVSSMLMFKSLT